LGDGALPPLPFGCAVGWLAAMPIAAPATAAPATAGMMAPVAAAGMPAAAAPTWAVTGTPAPLNDPTTVLSAPVVIAPSAETVTNWPVTSVSV
jgi:hypothetical protein